MDHDTTIMRHSIGELAANESLQVTFDSPPEKFLFNTRRNAKKIDIRRGLSQEVLPELDTRFDFVFIDGDHSEDSVRRDARNAFEILKPGGIMIIDDYIWGSGKQSPTLAIDEFLGEFELRGRRT